MIATRRIRTCSRVLLKTLISFAGFYRLVDWKWSPFLTKINQTTPRRQNNICESTTTFAKCFLQSKLETYRRFFLLLSRREVSQIVSAIICYFIISKCTVRRKLWTKYFLLIIPISFFIILTNNQCSAQYARQRNLIAATPLAHISISFLYSGRLFRGVASQKWQKKTYSMELNNHKVTTE